MTAFEVNFDGLVGPTHNFAGLSFGNIAATEHANQTSSPKNAALQGLEKMKALSDMGMPQAILPPHERPHIPTLKCLGFEGSDEKIIKQASKSAPLLFKQCISGSSMWVANAATVTPFADSADGLTHFTPANLHSMFHRSIEAPVTSRILRRVFSSQEFVHHAALPYSKVFADEGAANHTRFCADYAKPGVELFVYGENADAPENAPKKFPARQTLASVQALARLHGLSEQHAVFAQQAPEAIDAGVFHNDVISVGNRDLFFYHEKAFLNKSAVLAELQEKFKGELKFIEVKETELSLPDVVNSYLFNTQLITPPGSNTTCIIAPQECQENPKVFEYLENLRSSSSLISDVKYFDLKQSMNNGGGPACLRLRVVLKESQLGSLGAKVLLNDSLYSELRSWVEKHYRDTLAPQDLYDPALLNEAREALDALTQICSLGSIYDFQRNGE